MNTIMTWNHGLSFSAVNRNLQSSFDAPKEVGGSDSAPTPKEAVLNAMCACSGMDVVSIAKKMHTSVGKFWMEGHADKSATIPSYFSAVHLKYYFEGPELNGEKLIKAVALSMTKHCGVSYMISKVCKITYDVILNDQKIHEDKAEFQVEIVIE